MDLCTAVALSMYRDGLPLDLIRIATGLTDQDLAEAVGMHLNPDEPIHARPTSTAQQPSEAMPTAS